MKVEASIPFQERLCDAILSACLCEYDERRAKQIAAIHMRFHPQAVGKAENYIRRIDNEARGGLPPDALPTGPEKLPPAQEAKLRQQAFRKRLREGKAKNRPLYTDTVCERLYDVLERHEDGFQTSDLAAAMSEIDLPAVRLDHWRQMMRNRGLYETLVKMIGLYRLYPREP